MFTPRRRNRIAWIVLVAVLYAAASPLLAALRSPEQHSISAVICSIGGVKAPADDPTAPAGNHAQRQQHCLFCVGGAWQPAVDVALTLPAPAASPFVLSSGREGVHPLASPAHQPRSPRAPPRLA